MHEEPKPQAPQAEGKQSPMAHQPEGESVPLFEVYSLEQLEAREEFRRYRPSYGLYGC